MDVPILDLKGQHAAVRDELAAKVLAVLDSQQFILGAEVEALERELAADAGVAHAVGVSSGSDALLAALMALGIGPGDAVVTTPFSFFATAGAPARLGARTIFCDIDPVSFNLSPDRLAETLASTAVRTGPARVRAVIPVHLYGQCADMDPINALAREHGLFVLEDACQAVGSQYPSAAGIRTAGALGGAGTLSFYPTKNLGGIGDGGMVLTDDGDLAARLRTLRVHGERQRYHYDVVGGNFRLDALQAAALRVKRTRLPEWQAMRRARAAFYDKRFTTEGLTEAGLVRTPQALYKDSGARDFHTYHQYVIRARRRDELQAFLRGRGIGTAVFYPLGLHRQRCFADLGYKAGDFPATEAAAAEVLALPMYPTLTPEQQDRVVFSILEFYGQDLR